MSEPAAGRPNRLSDRSLPLLVAAAAVLLACFGIADSDFFWHLEHGERMLDERSLVAVDDWSHTAAGTEYAYYSWLAELFAALVFRLGGLEAVVFGKALLAGGVLLLLSAALGARGSRGLSRALLLLAALVLLRFRFYARPEIFTLLLLPAVDLLCLRWLERGSRKALWALPPILALWANLHPFAIVGLGVIGAHALGGLLEQRLRWRSSEARPALHLLGVTALCGLASLLNPWGWRIYAPVLKLWDSGPIGRLPTREWQPPDWEGFELFFVFAAVASVLVTSTIRRARVAELILFAAGLGLALLSLRGVGLFALMGAPATARALAVLLGRLPAAWWTPGARLGGTVLHLVLLVAVVRALLSPHASLLHLDESSEYRFGLALSRDSAPVGAAEFLQARGLTGPVWNSWSAGGWLVRCCWPDVRVSLDGRQLPYEEHLGRTLETGILPRILELELNTALVTLDDRSALVALRASPLFELVYFDDTAAVFVRSELVAQRDDLHPLRRLQPDALGLVWLDALGTSGLQEAGREAARATALAPESSRAFMYRGLVAQRLGDGEQALGYFRRAVALAPTQATHRVNLGIALLEADLPEEAERELREATLLEPEVALAHYNRALALVDLGRLRAARRSLDRSLRLDPAQARARILLAGIAREQGDRERMRRQAELALELAEPGSELAAAAERLIREAAESP